MPVYLDYNATSPLRPQALAAMQEALAAPANPSSVHGFGREAKKRLEQARGVIADAVGAWPDEVIFTASGTEANNTALRGFGGRVLVGAVEHSSVLNSSPHRGEAGRGAFDARSPDKRPHPSTRMSVEPPPMGEGTIPVHPTGLLDLTALDAMLAASDSPALVSVMLANNETGVIQPIAEIAAMCRKHGALLHSDAVQGLGKIPVDIGVLGCDLMTLSAHKCGGPVGAAALIVRRGAAFQPLLTGGGQERGMRAGTENVAAIAGFAAAIEHMDFPHMQQLRGWLEEMEREVSSPLSGGGGIIFSANAPRLPNTSCIVMPGVSNEVQLMDFDLNGFAISAGSACSSGRIEVSHVLLAMGVPQATARCAIRVSAGWATTQEEIGLFTEAWKRSWARLARKVG